MHEQARTFFLWILDCAEFDDNAWIQRQLCIGVRVGQTRRGHHQQRQCNSPPKNAPQALGQGTYCSGPCNWSRQTETLTWH